jgi:hypothetical protein
VTGLSSRARDRRNERAAASPWLARLVTTLAAWLAAYLLVLALLSVLGNELGSLPLAVRALVISGVVVTVMTSLVMPALSIAVRRWQAAPTRKRSPGATWRTRSGDGSDSSCSDDRTAGPADPGLNSLRSDTTI